MQNFKDFIFKIKRFSFSRIGIATLFLFIGICGTVLAKEVIKKNNEKSIDKELFDFDDDFYTLHNFSLSYFKKMQDRMDKIFENYNSRNFVSDKSEVDLKNDRFSSSVKNVFGKNEYVYTLSFFGYKKEDISVEIKDTVLTFFANHSSDTKDVYMGNKFMYSFVVPRYNKKRNPDIKYNDNSIVVTFYKV